LRPRSVLVSVRRAAQCRCVLVNSDVRARNGARSKPQYAAAIDAASRNLHDLARERLGALVAEARAARDVATLGFLLHDLAQVEARAGNAVEGHKLYREAASLDPLSPQPLLFYAESLMHAFAATATC
jgi:predicted Zn-dependent protease